MSETMRNNWSVQVAGMALIAIVGTAVFWVAEGFAVAWPFALVMLAFIALVHFGRRRSNVLEVMSGTGDERVRTLYMRALAFVGGVLIWVMLVWWLVTLLMGDPNETLNILCAVAGILFVLAVILLARRN